MGMIINMNQHQITVLLVYHVTQPDHENSRFQQETREVQEKIWVKEAKRTCKTDYQIRHCAKLTMVWEP